MKQKKGMRLEGGCLFSARREKKAFRALAHISQDGRVPLGISHRRKLGPCRPLGTNGPLLMG